MKDKLKRKRLKKNRKYSYIVVYCSLLAMGVICGAFLWNHGFNGKMDGRVTSVTTSVTRGTTKNEDLSIGSTDSDKNYPWNLILVNKKNPIPNNYKINLVKVRGGEQVDERIYEPLMKMLKEAKKSNLGKLPIVVAGYRSQEQQKQLFTDKIAEFKKEGYSDKEAEKQANTLVSVPGYSEHQIGLAVDINGATYDVYTWLQENSYKYGFIFRYPGNKMEITGVAEEVWHYRYVGVEVATEIHEKGLSLEEYLRDS